MLPRPTLSKHAVPTKYFFSYPRNIALNPCAGKKNPKDTVPNARSVCVILFIGSGPTDNWRSTNLSNRKKKNHHREITSLVPTGICPVWWHAEIKACTVLNSYPLGSKTFSNHGNWNFVKFERHGFGLYSMKWFPDSASIVYKWCLLCYRKSLWKQMLRPFPIRGQLRQWLSG